MRIALRLAVLAGITAALILLANGQFQSNAAGNAMDAMSIDMNPAASPANTATSIGSREFCARINENNSLDADEDTTADTVDVDVTATNIPVATAMVGFAYTLNYSDANLTVQTASVSPIAGSYLLNVNPSSSVLDASIWPDPDSNGLWISNVLDFGTGAGESGSGVLERLTISSDAGAATAIYGLSLTDAAHLDSGNNAYAPDAVNNATIAVDTACVTSPDPVVDTTSDAVLSACTTAPADCSLRGAIANSNAIPFVDTITFNIGAGGPQTIGPGSALPTITNPVIINGLTQPGCASYPCVAISGAGAGSVDGLTVTAGSSTIKGLTVKGFLGSGIALSGSGGNIIKGNIVELNGLSGISMTSSDNTIGGTLASEGNIIRNNGEAGVCLAGGSNNAVRGNSIYGNVKLGIDILTPSIYCGDGLVMANDSGDGDAGINGRMNYPVISTISYNNLTRAFTVTGTLDTASPDTATIDVYVTAAPDASSNGEAHVFLGSATPVSGAWTFTSTGAPPYGYVTATATKPVDGTSEFALTVDGDTDGDGLASGVDNCDAVYNPLQIDHDGDGIGDACDTAVKNRFTAASSSNITEFTVPVGQPLADSNRVIAPWDYQPGSGINIGAQAGTVNLTYVLKSATACDQGFSDMNVKLLNASVDNSPGNLVNTASILADGDGDTIPDGVEGYPRFLNTIYDPQRRTGIDEDGDTLIDEDVADNVDNDSDTRIDEDGVGTPVAPHARYFGRYAGASYFQILVFEEVADSRYRLELIFSDPTGPDASPLCAPFEITQTIYTTSVTNTDPNPDVTGGQAVLVDPPSGSGTRVFRLTTIDRPDADGDGLDNVIDNCDLVANPTQADADSDGIGDSCEPASGPCSATAIADCDGDGYSNVADNCPTIANASQAESEVRTPRPFGVPSIDDGIGDACDPNPALVDDSPRDTVEAGGVNRNTVAPNEFSDPICVTGGGVLDGDSDGWCAANDPNDGNAAITPENESLVLPAATGTFARGLCNNGVDDNGASGTDFADAACADADGDLVPDNIDDCPAAADPLQLDANTATAAGDACEAADIASVSAVSNTNAANSELRWRLVEVAPAPLHAQDGITRLVDSELDGTSDWNIIGGGSVANGAIRASLTTFVTTSLDPNPGGLSYTATPCNSVVPLNFTLMDASTDPNDSIDPGTTLNALGGDTDADGLMNGVEQYPAFLKTLPVGLAKIDNDGDTKVDEDPPDNVNNDGDLLTDEDGPEAATPLVRMFGYTTFNGAPHTLNVLVYGVGTLPAFPATDGYPIIMVYDNPRAFTTNGYVTAWCSHQDHRLFEYGVSMDLPTTAANEAGIKLMNNDSAAATERFYTRVATQPDADGDGIENQLDVCALDADNDADTIPDQIDPTPWNPRLVSPPGDMDGDGLPDKCDPLPLIPSPPGSPPDYDGDGKSDSADNCPTIANADQRDTDGDFIGDLCDPNTLLPSGAVQNVIMGHPICTAGTDADHDGYCTDTDVNDNSSTLVPESGVYDPSRCTNAPKDDDGDTLVDLADPDCADADGDGLLNQLDNCPNTKNGIAEANIPGVGNQTDTDGDVEANHTLGQQPFARTDLGDPYVIGEPFARTVQRWGGDACDVDDDGGAGSSGDGLPDGNECDKVDDADGFMNDGCPVMGLFSEADIPGACANNVDEPDEDLITPGPQNDDTVINDGCPAVGPSEDICRTKQDCDGDLIPDLPEWTWPCLDTDSPISPNVFSNNMDGDALFTYGETVALSDPCTNNNPDAGFNTDLDADTYKGSAEQYVGTTPLDGCPSPAPAAGQASSAWPADLAGGVLSGNKIQIGDISAFIAPVRRLNTKIGDAGFSPRFDLVVTPIGLANGKIDIQDLANLTTIVPMMAPFNGVTRAFGGPACTP